ncbi:hypothetical protein A2U01_0019541, partial [Trifolium medium]|nr:hypothetical protein [Trifolium medium]
EDIENILSGTGDSIVSGTGGSKRREDIEDMVSGTGGSKRKCMVVTTRHNMENRINAMDQRLGNVETTMEQIRQLLLERNERPRRRQGRPMGRVNPHHDEGEESEDSTISPGSWPRYHGGGGHGFYGGRRKLEIPGFKGDDAHGWLIRVNRYFRLNEVRE